MEKTLMQLVDESSDVIQMIRASGGEVTEEIQQMLLVTESNFAQKVDNYNIVLSRLEMEKEYWAEMAKKIQAVAKGYDNSLNFLKSNLKNAMLTLDKTEMMGDGYRFKLSKSKPIVEVDADKVPAEFLDEEVVYTPNKEKIRQALAEGRAVEGARLKESYQLRTYLNKKG